MTGVLLLVLAVLAIAGVLLYTLTHPRQETTMPVNEDERTALRSLWRAYADRDLDIGIDWPAIARTLFGDIADLERERDELRELMHLPGPVVIRVEERTPNTVDCPDHPHEHQWRRRRPELTEGTDQFIEYHADERGVVEVTEEALAQVLRLAGFERAAQ